LYSQVSVVFVVGVVVVVVVVVVVKGFVATVPPNS